MRTIRKTCKKWGPGQDSLLLGLGTVIWLAVAVLLSAPMARAATPDSPETWDSGGDGGWTRKDPLNGGTVPLGNPTNYLQVVFDSQTTPSPEVHIVQADASASGGDFAADYRSAGITNVSFKLYCEAHQPAQLRLYLYSGGSRNWWYYPLNAPAVGTWTSYSVTLEHSTGWRLGIGGNRKQFNTDLKDVVWVGVQIQRNKSTQEQTYGLDNFVLYGASRSEDADGDGMSDWAEFVSGSNPNDPNSLLEVEIAPTNAANGVVLRWRSVAHRTYAIPRAENLVEGFVKKIATDIEATPPVNVHVDTSVTNAGPYYYRIEVEE